MKRYLIGSIMMCTAGCAATDPLSRDGLWQPVGANAANLKAMLANPADLYEGSSYPAMDGSVAANAVTRYRAGRVKPLPDVSASKIGIMSSNEAGSPGPANTAASGAGE